MEEHNLNKKEVEQISNQVWKILSVLRGSIDSSKFNFILLILSAYNDGLLIDLEYNFSKNLNSDLLNTILKDGKYIQITERYKPVIESIPDDKLAESLNILSLINRNILKEHFSEIFDALLYKLSLNQGKKSGEFIQPFEISRFIMNLANLRKNTSVYNPFAGPASFSIFLKENQQYYGQENDSQTWALGMLRVLAQKQNNDIKYALEDSIKNWPKNKKFDLIVANPPYGLRIDDKGNTAENFLIEHGIDSISEEGQLICVLPPGFLFRGGRERLLREDLVNKNLIDTVISLPPGLLKHTGIPICIVVFKRTQSNNGLIRLINANDFIVNYRSKDKRLDDVRLSKILSSSEENEFVKLISKEEIREADFNLNVPRYFIKQVLGITLSPEIATEIKGKRALKGEYGKLVRNRDLKNNVIDFKLDINTIESRELLQIDIRKIEKSCLLLAIRWSTLKPTFFKFEGEPIYIPNDIIALSIDENKVIVYHLINELHKDYVKEQIDGFRINGVIPMIKKEDLFNIKIELPSLEEQNKKYYSITNEHIISVVKESQVAYKENIIDVEDENSFLRHQIAGSLKNARGALKFIKKILEEQVKPEFSGLYELKADQQLDSTLLTYLNILDSDLNSINKSVNRAGDKIDLMDLSIEKFDLLEFIKEYTQSLKITSKNFYTIILDMDENAITQYGISAIFIEGDKDLLRKMLNNIIDNAEKHAFKYGINNGNANKIAIYLMYDFEDFTVQIDISNTGKPLTENISHESYIRKGSSSGLNAGDGTGGWFIYEVMKIHKGSFGFTDETGSEGIDSEFVTTIELTFPIIPAI
jgi:type I restriction enzyme M protein